VQVQIRHIIKITRRDRVVVRPRLGRPSRGNAPEVVRLCMQPAVVIRVGALEMRRRRGRGGREGGCGRRRRRG
jgi:hypothetical protein